MSIKAGIENKLRLSFSYDGFHRVVEPHAYGVDRKGHEVLRAFQVRGNSESGEYAGWKLLRVNQISGTAVLSGRFAGPRPGYKRGDKAFSTIWCQL